MGRQARCTARFGARTSEGDAHLDKDRLTFRGGFKLDLPLADITSVEATDSALELVWPGGQVSLDLGAEAERWRLAIRYPKGRLEKLGVKPGARVSLVGAVDADLRDEVAAVAGAVVEDKAAEGSDVIFFAVATPRDLERLGALAACLRRDGALWSLRAKGRGAPVTESQVREAAKASGLVDVKVVSFSDTHTAEKLVIPLARR